jgi:3-oxoacyl-[acyl-carrier protein] reductase
MSKLTGKVAVVTGASKGIGAAIAKALAAEGASVVVNYSSSKEGADKVVAEIVAKGGKAIAVGGDVSETKKAYGKVDVLVNNAGVYEFSPLEGITEAAMQKMFGINVFGLVLTTQSALKLFPAEGGSVINIGSSITSQTPPNTLVYTASKAAVDSITRVLSKELGPRKIRVNSINPGGVETEGVHSAGFIGSDFFNALVTQTPLGRIGQPDDIARVAVFLSSEDSGWVTGETLLASGGLK